MFFYQGKHLLNFQKTNLAFHKQSHDFSNICNSKLNKNKVKLKWKENDYFRYPMVVVHWKISVVQKLDRRQSMVRHLQVRFTRILNGNSLCGVHKNFNYSISVSFRIDQHTSKGEFYNIVILWRHSKNIIFTRYRLFTKSKIIRW